MFSFKFSHGGALRCSSIGRSFRLRLARIALLSLCKIVRYSNVSLIISVMFHEKFPVSTLTVSQSFSSSRVLVLLRRHFVVEMVFDGHGFRCDRLTLAFCPLKFIVSHLSFADCAQTHVFSRLYRELNLVRVSFVQIVVSLLFIIVSTVLEIARLFTENVVSCVSLCCEFCRPGSIFRSCRVHRD